MDDLIIKKIQANPSFRELTGKRRLYSWSLTLLMLIFYFGFILVVAFAPGLLTKLGPAASISSLVIPIGLLVAAIVLIGIYVWKANSTFDGLTAKIAESVK
jgi:uncharacterized membrane protein (DUF485 family)